MLCLHWRDWSVDEMVGGGRDLWPFHPFELHNCILHTCNLVGTCFPMGGKRGRECVKYYTTIFRFKYKGTKQKKKDSWKERQQPLCNTFHPGGLLLCPANNESFKAHFKLGRHQIWCAWFLCSLLQPDLDCFDPGLALIFF